MSSVNSSRIWSQPLSLSIKPEELFLMPKLQSHPKITPQHLQRKAIVYLRQSSDRQVQRHTESQRLQYDLADRARALGFEQVDIIDADLGHSAAIGAGRREGFERLEAVWKQSLYNRAP